MFPAFVERSYSGPLQRQFDEATGSPRGSTATARSDHSTHASQPFDSRHSAPITFSPASYASSSVTHQILPSQPQPHIVYDNEPPLIDSSSHLNGLHSNSSSSAAAPPMPPIVDHSLSWPSSSSTWQTPQLKSSVPNANGGVHASAGSTGGGAASMFFDAPLSASSRDRRKFSDATNEDRIENSNSAGTGGVIAAPQLNGNVDHANSYSVFNSNGVGASDSHTAVGSLSLSLNRSQSLPHQSSAGTANALSFSSLSLSRNESHSDSLHPSAVGMSSLRQKTPSPQANRFTQQLATVIIDDAATLTRLNLPKWLQE